MKLRIKGDSLRLRLTRGEVEQLAASGDISVDMHLANATMNYSLHSDSSVQSLSAELADNKLTVNLPASTMRSWAESDQVSLRGQDGPLQILVEKDFNCLKPRDGEDDSDAFPHPDQSNSDQDNPD